MTDPRLTDLARELFRLKQNVRSLGSSAQLQYSSFEDGSIQGYSGNTQVMQIGLQWDGTYAPTVTNGPIPPTPSDPTVSDATEAVVIGWDGSFAGGLIPTPMDFLRVDAHVGATVGFVPSHSNRVGSFVSPQGGTLSATLPYGTYYVKLVMWTLAGKVSLATNGIEGDAWPVEVSSDGFPPASSPAVELVGGLEVLLARWPAVVNADPVTYRVDISTTTGFTPDLTTLVARTSATQLTIKALPGPAPANPDDPDLRKLAYNTDYFVRVTAEDADGAAAPGAQAFTQVFQITGDNIAVDTVRGNHIIGGEITGDKFASTLSVSSAFWTALAGQRAGFTPDGFFAFRPDDSPIFRIPTDGSNAFLDAEMILRGATVTGGLSIQNAQNELTADARLTLMRGTVAPSAMPEFTHDYEKLQPVTTGLSAGDKTGSMGTFDLVPSEVSQIEYKGGYWVIHQIRTNGTRSWFFSLLGVPINTVTGFYFTDVPGWQIWSTVTLSGSAVPARDGVYTMFFFPESGAWYLSHPTGISRYSLRNAGQTPVVGVNADDVFISEVLSTGALECKFVRPVGNADVPVAFSTRASTTGRFVNSTQLSAVQFRAGGYGTGLARYMFAQRSNGATLLLVNGSAVGSQILYPGSSSDSWTDANRHAESFECPTVQRRGTAYDGTQFWTYGADGFMYKHTSEVWNPNVVSSTIWGQQTWYDDVGTVHETKPGPARSFFYNRRARLKVTLPPPTNNGGVDDPNKVRLYMGRGATQPANAAMWLQGSATLGPVNITTLTTSGTNPPTVEGFPGGNAAIIRSDNDGVQVKGDGSVRMVSGVIGPAGGATEQIAVYGPYYYAYVAANVTVANSTDALVAAWTAGDGSETGETGSSGITHSAGVFTVPKAGWYRLNVGLMWAGHATGLREIKIFRGSSGGAFILYGDSAPGTVVNSITTLDRAMYFAASGQFRIFGRQESGNAGGLTLLGDSTGKFSYMSIEWIRP